MDRGNYTPACDKITDADLREAAGCSDLGSGNALPDVVVGLLNVVISVVGLVAVFMIVLGAVSYSLSQGDAGKVKKAKDTILYGVIGLIIAVLAFAIVNFVLKQF